MALLFELPICRQALEKTFLFAMSPLGGGGRRDGEILARPAAVAGRKCTRGGPGVLLARFGVLVGGRRRSAAAAGASRGGPPSGEGRVRPG
jgi:hypothetical protein